MNLAPASRRYRYPVLAGAVALYLASRLSTLLALPIFNDEAYYLRMAQLVRQGDWLVTFEWENLKALYVWLLALAWPLTADPLVAGRLLSIVFGLVTLVAFYQMAYHQGGWRPAALFAVLYLISPFMLLHERMALYDPLTMALATGAFWFAPHVVRNDGYRAAVFFGVFGGLGLLNKEIAYLTLAFPLAFLAADWWHGEAIAWSKVVRRLAYGWLVAGLILFLGAAFPLTRLGVGLFHNVHHLAAAEGITAQWAINVQRLSGVYWTYLGPGLILLATVQLGRGLARKSVWALATTLCWLGPSLVFLLLAHRFFARYLLFLFPILFLSVVDLLGSIASPDKPSAKRWRGLVTAIILLAALWPARLATQILVDPAQARLWPPDREQYVTDWPAGYGAREMLARLKLEAQQGPLTVFTGPIDGFPKDFLNVYAAGLPNIQVRVAAWSQDQPVLFFLQQTEPFYYRPEPYLRHEPPVVLDTSTIRRAVYVLDLPQVKLNSFVALNPEARLLFEAVKPGGRSRFVIVELPLPPK